MKTTILNFILLGILAAYGCTATETVVEPTDFKFDGTCVNCHNGLSAGHAHTNFKLRCVDCHGGDDQVAVAENAHTNKSLAPGGGGYRDPLLVKATHVMPGGFCTQLVGGQQVQCNTPKDCPGGNNQCISTIARLFYANGIDDDGDGNCFNNRAIKCTADANCGAGGRCQLVDEPPVYDDPVARTQLIDPGEVFEPGLHGEGGGEFMDMELNRDLNYTRFINPGDLRVASVSCGGFSRGAFDGGGGGLCHQQTIDIVRRSIMVNQAAVTNGAYYGNESWRTDFINRRDMPMRAEDPRFGAFGYGLDYTEADSVDNCILPPANPNDPRSQPVFDRECLQDRALVVDGIPARFGGNSIAAGTLGNTGVTGEQWPTMDIGQGRITAVNGAGATTLRQVGAGDTRYPWGGQPATGDATPDLEPLLTDFLPGLGSADAVGQLLAPTDVTRDGATGGIPDPVDNILRTFRAYYPLNYPASTNNFNFTFGTSLVPEVQRFRTGTPYGRGHSSGCAACHTPYAYDGARQPTKIRKEDPQDTNGDGVLQDAELFDLVVDPTTKHREFNPAKDRGPVVNDILGVGLEGNDRLLGRPVQSFEVVEAGPVAQQTFDLDGNGTQDGEQQKNYSQNHTTTTKIDTETCGLCHGFVTRINYAYQGMAEEEQRDSLSRRQAISFMTPGGTRVNILDSWIREDFDPENDGIRVAIPQVIVPAGVDIVNRARTRDAQLLAEGFVPAFGGCVPSVFTEDCNNNGELDTSLTLEKKDAFGKVIASKTINEDLNGNGMLDLIDRLPREKAIDGRQVRYIYGGRNGSTRQMDVHFERGMHCIDCHFIQDVHGDGNVYSTNWDNIEIECEDCHGALQRTNFLTSGPNGGNDLRLPVNEDLEPFFEDVDGAVIQRSRVTKGLAWRVPQTAEVNAGNPYATEAHAEQHVANPGEGSTFAGAPGITELTSAKVECATCHNGFVTNCLGCHVEINVGDKQRFFVNSDGSIVKSAGENEIWLSNKHNEGHINFQLMGLLRGAVYLGVASSSEKGRLATMRSSMQVHAGVSDAGGNTVRENLTFTTFQAVDGNTGRMNVANSGVAKNQTMGHTVRPGEARGCEICHSLVNDVGQVRNEHLMAQTFSLGSGSLPFTGDWIFATGTGGLELFEYKSERELGNNIIGGASTRFPGMIFNQGNDGLTTQAGNVRTIANVEPVGITQANDVVLIRNFNPEPAIGGTVPPTLRDFAVTAIDQGGVGQVVISDVGGRGHPNIQVAQRPPLNDALRVEVVNVAQPPLALAHLASDISDPFVYAAVGTSGLQAVKLINATLLQGNITAMAGTPIGVGGETAIDVALAGDYIFVGTQQGRIHIFDARQNPLQPSPVGTPFVVGAAVNDIHISGFMLYAATPSGLTALSIDFLDADFAIPSLGPPIGETNVTFTGPPANAVYVSEGHAFVAAGANGIHEIDARNTAAMVDLGELEPGQAVNATDVIVSQLPGQKWVVGLEITGDVVYIKLNNTETRYQRCSEDPKAADCDMELERFDPTRSGRDPSFDPVNRVFDNPAVDPSSRTFARQISNIITGGGRRLAKPTLIETIGTLSGRRYRDSFMPGSSVLSTQVMQRMREVEVCELDGRPSNNPSGLDEIGYFLGGGCEPLSSGASKPKRKRGPVRAKLGCKDANADPTVRGIACDDKAKPTMATTRRIPIVSASASGSAS